LKKKTPLFLICIGFIPFSLSFLGHYNWILDGFSHFRIYFGIYFLVVGVLLLFFKKRKEAFISLFLSLAIGLTLIKFYLPVQHSFKNASTKIISINLLSSNNDFEEVLKFIESENPEIVVLQEVNQKWYNQLKVLETEFLYQLKNIREDNFGLIVLSKVPFIESEEILLSKSGVPSYVFKILSGEKKVDIIATHPLPPVGAAYFDSRNEQFENINKYVRSVDGNVVIVGDLNVTSFSSNFSRITEGTKLRDSRLGFGLQPTWSAQIPFISVAIDHVLVSEEISVVDRRVGIDIGSDHFPIIIEIAN